MEYKFKKVHTVKDLAISILILLAGVALFFVSPSAGVIIAICGLLSLLLYKSAYKLEGSTLSFKKVSEDLCKSCRASVLDFLNGKEVEPVITKGNEGGSVRLDVFFNKAEATAYAILYDFSNYSYVAVTDVVELKGKRADELIAKL